MNDKNHYEWAKKEVEIMTPENLIRFAEWQIGEDNSLYQWAMERENVHDAMGDIVMGALYDESREFGCDSPAMHHAWAMADFINNNP